MRRVTSMNFCGHILETLADFYYFLKLKDFSTFLAYFNSIEKLRLGDEQKWIFSEKKVHKVINCDDIFKKKISIYSTICLIFKCLLFELTDVLWIWAIVVNAQEHESMTLLLLEKNLFMQMLNKYKSIFIEREILGLW